MNLNQFDDAMDDYLGAIRPTRSQTTRIETSLENILSLIMGTFPDANPEGQGSHSTDTMVKPLTANQNNGVAGEYDIDLAIVREQWGGAKESLDEVNDMLMSDDVYGRMPIDNTKDTCVRIEYAEDQTGVAFHLDLVPTLNSAGVRTVPVRAEDTWKSSDARQFADWFNGQADVQPNLRGVVVILKRLRDLGGFSLKIKSILVLTLATNHYMVSGSLMGDLLSVLDGIVGTLPVRGPEPRIANPVNDGEDLLDGVDSYTEVASFFADLREQLMAAVSDDDADKLAEIFGPGFRFQSNADRVAVAAALPVATIRPTRAYGVSDAENNR